MREWKNIFHANGNQKKARVAILISDKIDLKIKNITRDKEGHYIIIKGSIQEQDITIVNICTHDIGTHQYIRKTLIDIKGEIDSNTIIVGDFNTPLTPMDRSSKQKINNETAAAKSLQSCPTLCDPIDGSPPGSPVPGILQARTLEGVAISFPNA